MNFIKFFPILIFFARNFIIFNIKISNFPKTIAYTLFLLSDFVYFFLLLSTILFPILKLINFKFKSDRIKKINKFFFVGFYVYITMLFPFLVVMIVEPEPSLGSGILLFIIFCTIFIVLIPIIIIYLILKIINIKYKSNKIKKINKVLFYGFYIYILLNSIFLF